MPDNPLPEAESSSRSTQTLRLTFSSNGRSIQLINSQRIAMITPPSVTPPPAQGQSGYWLEVRDASDRLLYHRAVHDPVRADIEVYSDDSAQTITRVPNPNPVGEFTLLLPDLPQADTFFFYGTPIKAKDRFAPSEILAKHSFEDLRRFSSNTSREPDRQNAGQTEEDIE